MELKNWMKDIDGGRALFTLDIPATHNSAAVRVQSAAFGKCQDIGVYEQLSIGVRVLDLRFVPKGDRLLLVHGFAKIYGDNKKQMDFDEVLSDCKRFLRENPSETVVIQFKNDNNKNQEQCFENLLKYIENDRSLWCLKDTVPTLNEARGKLVLLRRCRGEAGTGIDFSGWAEQDEKLPEALMLYTGKERFFIQDRYNYSAKEKWDKVIKPFLDGGEQNGFVLNYLSTAGGSKIPRSNAAYINKRFMAYPLEKDKYYGIIYLDFVNEKLTEKIVKNNFS